MSLKSGFRALGQRKSAAPIRSPTALTLDNPAGWLTGEEDATMSRDRAMKISTVNRCVEVLGNAMGVLPTYVMDEGSKKHRDDHYLGRVLWERPNELMTPFDFNRLLMCNELLRGNAYAWSYRTGNGDVVERIPLPPDCVSHGYDENGRYWYLYTDPKTGKVWRIRPEDMTHYKAYSEDGLTGISTLQRASMTLRTAQHAQRYEESVWRNNGQPSGILTTESDLGNGYDRTLDDGTVIHIDPKEQLRKSWEAVHGNPGNAFRVAVLDLGLKYQPISMTNADAQFVESNEIRVVDICRFFGVPTHLVYAGKQSYASNEQNGIEFVTYTLIAYETQWGQEDSHKLLLPSEIAQGLRIRRNLKIFLRGDTAAQASWYRAMREIGAYSVDDIRAYEDLPTVPGGDTRYASWNYGPLDDFARLSVIRALGGKLEDENNE